MAPKLLIIYRFRTDSISVQIGCLEHCFLYFHFDYKSLLIIKCVKKCGIYIFINRTIISLDYGMFCFIFEYIVRIHIYKFIGLGILYCWFQHIWEGFVVTNFNNNELVRFRSPIQLLTYFLVSIYVVLLFPRFILFEQYTRCHLHRFI